jgi:hypothetical protein
VRQAGQCPALLEKAFHPVAEGAQVISCNHRLVWPRARRARLLGRYSLIAT